MITRAVVGDAALAAIGIAACIFGVQQGIGAINAPESGLMPFLVGAVLAALALPGLLRRTEPEPAANGTDDSPMLRNPRGWALTVTAFVGLAVGVAYLSFVPAVFLFTLLLFTFSGPRRIAASVVYATLVTFASWFVFVFWFGVSFG